jgi:hypothetical protein
MMYIKYIQIAINQQCLMYLIHFFLEIRHIFRFYVRSLEYSYVFSDPNIHFRTEVRSYPKKRSYNFFQKSEFRRRRTAGRPRDHACHFDIKFSRNQNFDRDRRGLGPAVLCRAGPSQNGRFFLENRTSRGANLQVCCRRDELGLATPTSRRPLGSRPPLGQDNFLPGRVGKGVISRELEKKVLSAVSR